VLCVVWHIHWGVIVGWDGVIPVAMLVHCGEGGLTWFRMGEGGLFGGLFGVYWDAVGSHLPKLAMESTVEECSLGSHWSPIRVSMAGAVLEYPVVLLHGVLGCFQYCGVR